MNTDLILLSIHEVERLSERYCEEKFPKRMEKARRFLRKEDQLRCIGAGVLLHGVLGIKEETLCYTEHKKPFVSDNSTHFNLSHSGDYVILATDSDDVGTDIEIIEPSHLDLAKEVFLLEERVWMQADPISRFFVLWTLKESVMKQCSLGLSLSPKTFSVIPLLRGECLMLGGKKLYSATEFIDGHCISVCTSHPIESLAPRIITANDIEY